MAEPFTEADAKALAARLEMGLSDLDENGYEIPRSRPPKRPRSVVSWEMLYQRYGGVQVPDIGALDRLTPAERCAVEAAEAERERERLEQARLRSEARLGAIVEERAQARQRLPCYPFDPMAGQGEGRSDIAAVRACQAVAAYRTCEWAREPTGTLCPRVRIDIAYTDAARRLHEADAPMGTDDNPGLGRVVLASLPGHRVRGDRVAPLPLEPRPALAAVEAFLAGPQTILGLGGPQRCGKSLAAVVALSRVDGAWVTGAHLSGIPIQDFDLVAYTTPPLLVIDDLGTETLTQWAKSRLFSVVAECHAHGKRTILTTNIGRASFAARYGERLDRRITESGRWVWLPEWTGTTEVQR